jgi:hypothetical protein
MLYKLRNIIMTKKMRISWKKMMGQIKLMIPWKKMMGQIKYYIVAGEIKGYE